MASFLFWNIYKKDLSETIAQLLLEYDVDVLMLVESEINPAKLLQTLNGDYKLGFYYTPGIGCEKIHIYSRFFIKFMQPEYEDSRLTIRHLRLPGSTEILLAVNHFPSKANWSNDSQNTEIIGLANTIRDTEEKVNHSRTVLVGDLNMNPFESGLVSAGGLHGVMTKAIAQKESRTVQDTTYPYFYNPMWSLLGDASPGVAGTFYQHRSEHHCYFWNMFDQVLIRPDLLNRFSNKDLKIIDRVGDHSLLNSNGIPDKKNFSDHLPLYFKLNL